ncbi:carbamoyl-phosphate synthase [Synechococcus sp. MIT S9503]|uniref:carbamoyl-phosphate synthase n=1 Tax=Synechococcus sp. MIT S9503 TaxID=3082547 RepID=UPI0039A6A61C
MLRRLSIGLLASAVAIAPLPLKAQDGTAEDLGDVMSISLKDVVKPTLGFQGALQGAGTPNQAGIGGFLPLSVGDNSVWFVDALVNANFADRSYYSSIVDTTVAGTTLSTSTRLGYRWLNGNRSWMYGLNVGYDSRPMNSGYADSGVAVEDGFAFYQQIAFNLEAVSDRWSLNGYGLIPFGETTKELNWNYNGGALQTYGLDAGYMLKPDLKISLGGYYQKGDYNKCMGEDEVDNAGLRSRIAYKITNRLVAGVNASYDDSYDWRVSADIKYRLGLNGNVAPNNKKIPASIYEMSSTPANRDIRVHDPHNCGRHFRF